MTILYIDDDKDDQEIFRQALSMVSPDTLLLRAMNAKEAFDILATLVHNLPHYIFLDLNMPGKDGKQTLIELKMSQKFKKIPVIVYTTSSSPEDMRDVRQLGAVDFITKKNTLYEICQTLQIIL